MSRVVVLGVSLLVGLAVAGTLSSASADRRAGAASCRRSYPDLLRVYRRLVIVYERRGLTCSQAASIGSAVATRYERGLPLANYPPLPNGVPGGQGRPFNVGTRLGKFNCRMTSRGSDFVAATCSRSTKWVRFVSMNHWYVVKP